MTVDDERIIHEELISKAIEIAQFNTKEHCLRGKKFSIFSNVWHFFEHPTKDFLEIVINDLKNYLEYYTYFSVETYPSKFSISTEKIGPIIEKIRETAVKPSKSVYELEKIDIPLEKPKIEILNHDENNFDYKNKTIEELLEEITESKKMSEEKQKEEIKPEEDPKEKSIVEKVVDVVEDVVEDVKETTEEIVDAAEEVISETIEDIVEETFGKQEKEQLPTEEPVLEPAAPKWIKEPKEYKPEAKELQEELDKKLEEEEKQEKNPIIEKVEQIREKVFPKKKEETFKEEKIDKSEFDDF